MFDTHCVVLGTWCLHSGPDSTERTIDQPSKGIQNFSRFLESDLEQVFPKPFLWFVSQRLRVASLLRNAKLTRRTQRMTGAVSRVPTAPGKPGKPGKTGPDLENLEKQGVLGQKPGKILQNLEKILTLPQKSPKASTEKVSEKKSNSRKRFQIFLSLFGQRFGNYWFLLELQKCSSDTKNSFQARVLRIKILKNSNLNWFTGCFSNS